MNNLSMNNYLKLTSRRSQRGSSLLWGLSILLVMSVISVAAARMGMTDTRIVGNEMHSMLAYQGAESQLNLVRPPLEMLAPSSSLAFIKLTMEQATKTFVVPQTNTAVLFHTDKLNTNVKVQHDGFLDQCPPLETSMSVEMNGDKYRCSLFVIDADSRFQSTGARSLHKMGIVHFMPSS
ncbi:MAG: hypothetical protein E6Q84_04810 [Thiothrix sp.]|nr:MAG: hypothetical protein E6Q84_04810 [Thiothrix sp.]